jgi:methyl-accepting chemotaxis protein
VRQITATMTQLAQLTQEAAASAEQSATAATELAGQSEQLQALVGQFALERGRHRVPTLAAAD